jgi:hypothetical protein
MFSSNIIFNTIYFPCNKDVALMIVTQYTAVYAEIVVILLQVLILCDVFGKDILCVLHTLLWVWNALKTANPSRNAWKSVYGNIITHLTEYTFFKIICVILQSIVKLSIQCCSSEYLARPTNRRRECVFNTLNDHFYFCRVSQEEWT